MEVLMKTILIIFFMVAIQSCKTYAETKANFQENNVISQKSYDEVWQKLVQWCAIHQIPIKCTNKSSGMLNAEFNLYDISGDDYSNYIIDSGVVPINSCYVNVYILIKSMSNKIEIKIISHFEGTKIRKKVYGKQLYTNSETFCCNSTGKMEKEIFEYINH